MKWFLGSMLRTKDEFKWNQTSNLKEEQRQRQRIRGGKEQTQAAHCGDQFVSDPISIVTHSLCICGSILAPICTNQIHAVQCICICLWSKWPCSIGIGQSLPEKYFPSTKPHEYRLLETWDLVLLQQRVIISELYEQAAASAEAISFEHNLVELRAKPFSNLEDEKDGNHPRISLALKSWLTWCDPWERLRRMSLLLLPTPNPPRCIALWITVCDIPCTANCNIQCNKSAVK